MKRNEDTLREFWESTNLTNICIIGVPEGEEERKSLRRNSCENFTNLGNSHPS